jgi:hypothetical protein
LGGGIYLYCRKCGVELFEDASFCDNCGTKLFDRSKNSTREKQGNEFIPVAINSINKKQGNEFIPVAINSTKINIDAVGCNK